jgi:hypothetical protein
VCERTSGRATRPAGVTSGREKKLGNLNFRICDPQLRFWRQEMSKVLGASQNRFYRAGPRVTFRIVHPVLVNTPTRQWTRWVRCRGQRPGGTVACPAQLGCLSFQLEVLWWRQIKWPRAGLAGLSTMLLAGSGRRRISSVPFRVLCGCHWQVLVSATTRGPSWRLSQHVQCRLALPGRAQRVELPEGVSSPCIPGPGPRAGWALHESQTPGGLDAMPPCAARLSPSPTRLQSQRRAPAG